MHTNPHSIMEFTGQGLNRTLWYNNHTSSGQPFGEYLPQASSSTGIVSSSTAGSDLPAPSNNSGKRKRDNEEKGKGEKKAKTGRKTVTIETPWKCMECDGKMFNRRKDLHRHKTTARAHWNPDTGPAYYCAYCWTASPRAENIKRHFGSCPKSGGKPKMLYAREGMMREKARRGGKRFDSAA